jgi:hypothetical protein
VRAAQEMHEAEAALQRLRDEWPRASHS